MPSLETNVPPRCPDCNRLTVDNRQHCNRSTMAWQRTCALMQCTTCGTVYGKAGSFKATPPKPNS